jgi:zinc transporter 9
MQTLQLEEKRSAYHGEPSTMVYRERDVISRAREVHGSADAVMRILRLSAALFPPHDEQDIVQRRRDSKEQRRQNSSSVVYWAIFMNSLDAVFKYFGWFMTGSHALFAEAVHSTLDTCNQCVLAVGIHTAAWKPNEAFPYGYGNVSYVTSFATGIGIFFFGCGVSIYHGIDGLLHPHDLEPLAYVRLAYARALTQACTGILCTGDVIRISIELGIPRRLHVASTRSTGQDDYVEIQFVMRTCVCTRDRAVNAWRDPSLNVLLLEDGVSVLGVGIALSAITLSSVSALPVVADCTRDQVFATPMYDSIGSILIGTLLGGTATLITYRNSRRLIGQSIPADERQKLVDLLRNDPIVS